MSKVGGKMKSTVLFRSNWYFHYRLWRIPIPFYNEYNKGNLGCTWYKYSFIWYSWISTQSLKTTCITICKNKILEKKLKVIKSSDIAFIAIFLSNFLSLHTAEKSTYINKTNSQGCRCFTSKIGFFSVQVYYKFQTSDFNKHLPPSQHTKN